MDIFKNYPFGFYLPKFFSSALITLAIVMLILGLIPILGWLVILVLWLITLGALTTNWKKEQVQS